MAGIRPHHSSDKILLPFLYGPEDSDSEPEAGRSAGQGSMRWPSNGAAKVVDYMLPDAGSTDSLVIKEIYAAKDPFTFIRPEFRPDGEISLNRSFSKNGSCDLFYFLPTKEPRVSTFINKYCCRLWVVHALDFHFSGNVHCYATIYYGSCPAEAYAVYKDYAEALRCIGFAAREALTSGRLDEPSYLRILNEIEARQSIYAVAS